MKKLLIFILAIASITPAYAEHGRGRGGRGDWFLPAVVGGIIAYDLTYPYRYPVYEQPYPVYVQTYPVYEQPVQVQPQPQVQSWYYCASEKSYYPYVANCPEGWKLVPSQPPQQTGPR